MENNVKEMSIAELVGTPEYKKNLQSIIDKVCKSRLQMANAARKRDRQLKRHPIDRLIERDFFTADKLAPEFLLIVDKKSNLPTAERTNIETVGWEAFGITLKELAKGNPDAEKRLKALKK